VADNLKGSRNYTDTGVVATDDIVTRLREFAGDWDHVGLVPGDDLREAAAEIERLRSELEQSRQDHLATFLELMAVHCG
jgi:hypothetical protein